MAEFTSRPSFASFVSPNTIGGRFINALRKSNQDQENKKETARLKNVQDQIAFATEGKLEKQIVNSLSRTFSSFESESFDSKATDKVQAIDDAFHDRNPRKGVAKKIQAKYFDLIQNPENAVYTPEKILNDIVASGEDDLKESFVELRRRRNFLGGRLVSDEDVNFSEAVKQEADFRDFQDDFVQKASIDAIRLNELRTGITAGGQNAEPISPEEYQSLLKGGSVGQALAKGAREGIDLTKTDPVIPITIGALNIGVKTLTKAGREANLARGAFGESLSGNLLSKIFKGATLASIPASFVGGPAVVAANLARIGLSGAVGGLFFDMASRGIEKLITEKSPASALENPITTEVAKLAVGLSPGIIGAKMAGNLLRKSEILSRDGTNVSNQLALMKINKRIDPELKIKLGDAFFRGEKDLKLIQGRFEKSLVRNKILSPDDITISAKKIPSLTQKPIPLLPGRPAFKSGDVMITPFKPKPLLTGKPFGVKPPDESLKPGALIERGFNASKRSFKGSEEFNKLSKTTDDLINSLTGFTKGASTTAITGGIKRIPSEVQELIKFPVGTHRKGSADLIDSLTKFNKRGLKIDKTPKELSDFLDKLSAETPTKAMAFKIKKLKANIEDITAPTIEKVLETVKASPKVKKLVLTKPEKVISASKLIEGETEFSKQFAKIIRDETVDPTTKFILNQTRRRLIVESGLSEEQAASLAVTVAKGAPSIGKTVSEIVTKVKNVANSKTINIPQGINILGEKLSEKMFKVPFNELTTKEQFQVMQEMRKGKRLGDIFGLAATATAFAAFTPEDAEAGVIDSTIKMAKFLFDKGDLAKIADRATKKTGPELASFAVNAGKDVGLNLDLKAVTQGKIGPLDSVFGNTFNNLKKLGPEGKTFINLHLAEDGATEIGIVRAIQRIKDSLPLSQFKKEHQSVIPKLMTNLPKKEQFLVRGLMNGTVKSGPRELVETAGKLRNFLDDLFEDARNAGVDVVGYRKNYVPQIAIPEYFQSPENQKKFIKFLMEGDGKIGPQVNTIEEAVFHLKRFLKDSSDNLFTPAGSRGPKIAGSIEKSRRITLPDEAVLGGTTDKFGNVHFLESLEIYANHVIRRTNQARFFGPNNEKIKPLVDSMLKTDPHSKFYINNAFTVLQHKNPSSGLFNAPPAFKSFSATVRAIEAIDLLGYAGISQLGQSLMTTIKFGAMNTFKGAMKLAFSKASRGLVEASAAVSPHQHNLLLEQYGATQGIAGNISRKAMQFYMINAMDRTMRRIAASSGGEYARSTIKKLMKNPKDSLAIRQLDELGIDTRRIVGEIASGRGSSVKDPVDFLRNNELLEAMKRASDMTQFRSRHGDLPLWFRSDWAKIPTQFKSFVFQAGSMVNQHIIKEATGANGQVNLLPLMRALTFSPFVGSGILELRENAKEFVGKSLGAPNSYYRTIGKFRRELNNRQGGPFSKPRGIFADNSIHRVLTDASYALAPGIVVDTMMDLLHGNATAPALGGPAGDRIFKMGNAIFDSLDAQDLDAMMKELKAGVDSPLLGKLIKEMGIVDRFHN